VRQPSPTFRDELKANQQRLKAYQPQPTGRELPKHWLKLASRIIERWLKDPRAKKMWTTLQSRLKPDSEKKSPEEFIWLVIRKRLEVEEAKRVIKGLDKVGRDATALTVKLARERELDALPALTALWKFVVDERERLLRREAPTAPRQRFIWEWTELFRAICGKPCDDVIVFLTYVAFGEELSIDAVRGASRVSTRGGRLHRYTRPPR
jgi:hypothetical protein